MIRVFPSIMAADQLNMQKEIEALEPHCDGFHIDIMDDHFVPNITWGVDFIDAVNRVTAKPLWVQLMVENTTRWAEKISLNANSILTFHIESAKEIRKLVNIIKKKNIVPSIAVNPKTPVERIFPFLDVVHHVVIMSVDPGFSGQPFLPEVEKKIEELLGYCSGAGIKITIGMDGGISEKNIARLAKLGVEDFAVGSGIFKNPDRVAVIKKLYELCEE